MPRKAREKKIYSNYYISQNGPKSDVVFSSKEDRKCLIDILWKVKDKYNFKLYGISISANGYEFLLYDNGNDISKIMKSINISFAMQYKCRHENCKTIFKERYKSKIVEDFDLQEILNKMPLCIYIDSLMLDKISDINSEDDLQCIDCFKKAKEKLEELIDIEGYTYDEMIIDKKLRNDLIKDFRKNSVLNLNEIGELFGGLSESAICKILNKC